jgi:hypothetical protein
MIFFGHIHPLGALPFPLPWLLPPTSTVSRATFPRASGCVLADPNTPYSLPLSFAFLPFLTPNKDPKTKTPRTMKTWLQQRKVL